MKDLHCQQLVKSQSYVNGQWLSSNKTFSVINPASLDVIENIDEITKPQVEQAIKAAKDSLASWRNMASFQRAKLLQNWANLILKHKNDLALIMTREQGKTLADATGEILYGHAFIEWFAEEGKRIYGDTVVQHTANREITVIKQPVGVVAAITPWNFPNAMITRKAAAALAAGCTFIVKPAAETPLSALALAYLADKAQIPPGVFNVLVGKNAQTIGETLTSHPDIAKFTFTGSTAVGKKLNTQCASSVKKVSMELGGNAPFIIFDDANLDIAVSALTSSKLRNCGQTCISPNRIYVHESIKIEFTNKLLDSLRVIKQGNGEKASVDIGSLIHPEAAQKIDKLVISATDNGAKVLNDRAAYKKGSSFYPVTVLADVLHGDAITQCEIFGPVFTIIEFKDEESVIQQANDTEFGLASYLFSENVHRIHRITRALEYGMIGVNDSAISHPIAPFGGVKQSGFGKEGSKYGLDDYLTIKAISSQYY